MPPRVLAYQVTLVSSLWKTPNLDEWLLEKIAQLPRPPDHGDIRLLGVWITSPEESSPGSWPLHIGFKLLVLWEPLGLDLWVSGPGGMWGRALGPLLATEEDPTPHASFLLTDDLDGHFRHIPLKTLHA